MLPNRKKKSSSSNGPGGGPGLGSAMSAADQTKKNEEDEIEQLKKELEFEQKSKDTADWSNDELERSVKAMERNVQALENGNLEADDSEVKVKYDNQRQLNVQLQEQKRWLEHELEQVQRLLQALFLWTPCLVQKANVHPFSLTLSHASINATKRHKYSQGLS